MGRVLLTGNFSNVYGTGYNVFRAFESNHIRNKSSHDFLATAFELQLCIKNGYDSIFLYLYDRTTFSDSNLLRLSIEATAAEFRYWETGINISGNLVYTIYNILPEPGECNARPAERSRQRRRRGLWPRDTRTRAIAGRCPSSSMAAAVGRLHQLAIGIGSPLLWRTGPLTMPVFWRLLWAAALKFFSSQVCVNCGPIFKIYFASKLFNWRIVFNILAAEATGQTLPQNRFLMLFYLV